MGIPTNLKNKLLVEAHNKCTICGESGVQIHHIDGNKENNDESNLIVLCLRHHDEAEKSKQGRGLSVGIIPKQLYLYKKKQSIRKFKVFLSYASADREVARKIADQLRAQGVRVWFGEYELHFGDSISSAIDPAISASDYLIVLLSPHSVNSRWVQQELNAALTRELTTRDVTLLPVLIADCEIPQLLASRRYLDIRSNFEHGVKQLVEQIRLVPDIDFSRLDAKSFEQLIIDLLRVIEFTEIEREWKVADKHVDIKAIYSRTDPFGAEVTETWLVEVKFYRKSRADLQSIYQLASYLSTFPENVKGLLITNSQITSTARQWLESMQSQSRIEIRVLDGTDLKRLLLRHKNIAYKYFKKRGGTR